MAKSEWSFKSAVELSAALTAKKVSAVELTQDAIDRIERHDGKVNAICVRDFERALDAAREADAALGARRAQAAARRADDGEGILQRRRPAHHLGLSAAEGFQAAGGRAVGLAGEGCRRRHPRQDQRAARARRLAELQRDLRHDQQSLGSRPHAGRLVGRLGGGAGGGLRRRSRSAPTSAARCACRRITAASMRTSRPTISCPRAATRRRRCQPLPLERDLAVIGPMARSAVDLALLLDVIAGPDRWRPGIGYRLALPRAAPRGAEGFPRAGDRQPSAAADRPATFAARSRGWRGRLARARGQASRAQSPLFPDFADASRLYMRMLMVVLGAFWPPGSIAGARAGAAQLPADDKSLAAERLRGIGAQPSRLGVRRRRSRRPARAMAPLVREFDAVICPACRRRPIRMIIRRSRKAPDRYRRQGLRLSDQLAWPGIAT